MMWYEEVSEGPRGDHNPPGRAHLEHLPMMLFAPKILKYSEKIVLNF